MKTLKKTLAVVALAGAAASMGAGIAHAIPQPGLYNGSAEQFRAEYDDRNHCGTHGNTTAPGMFDGDLINNPDCQAIIRQFNALLDN